MTQRLSRNVDAEAEMKTKISVDSLCSAISRYLCPSFPLHHSLSPFFLPCTSSFPHALRLNARKKKNCCIFGRATKCNTMDTIPRFKRLLHPTPLYVDWLFTPPLSEAVQTINTLAYKFCIFHSFLSLIKKLDAKLTDL